MREEKEASVNEVLGPNERSASAMSQLERRRVNAQKIKFHKKLAFFSRKGMHDEVRELLSNNPNIDISEDAFAEELGNRQGHEGRLVTAHSASMASLNSNISGTLRELSKLPEIERSVYTNKEAKKYMDKTLMRFFKGTNQYGLTPSQETEIEKNHEGKYAPPKIISKSQLYSGQKVILARKVSTLKVKRSPKNSADFGAEIESKLPLINLKSSNQKRQRWVKKKPIEANLVLPNSKRERTQRMNTQRSTLDSERPEKYTPLYPSLDGNEPNKLFSQLDYHQLSQKSDEVANSKDAKNQDKKQETSLKKEDEATVPILKTEIPEANGTKTPEQNPGENSKPENSSNVVKTTQEAQKLTLASDANNNSKKDGQSVFEQDIIREGDLSDKNSKKAQESAEEKNASEAKQDEF